MEKSKLIEIIKNFRKELVENEIITGKHQEYLKQRFKQQIKNFQENKGNDSICLLSSMNIHNDDINFDIKYLVAENKIEIEIAYSNFKLNSIRVHYINKAFEIAEKYNELLKI